MIPEVESVAEILHLILEYTILCHIVSLNRDPLKRLRILCAHQENPMI